MDAERGPLEHGCESARSVSEMMSEGTHAVGKRYVRKRGIPQGGRCPLWRLVHRRLSKPGTLTTETMIRALTTESDHLIKYQPKHKSPQTLTIFSYFLHFYPVNPR